MLKFQFIHMMETSKILTWKHLLKWTALYLAS